MAIFEDALRNHLVRLDVVGARVYPQRPPPGARTYPLLTFFKVTQIDSPQAISGGAPSWQRALYQIDVWAQTYREAREIAESIRLAIEGATTIIDGWRVALSRFRSRDEYHDDLQEPGVHRAICEVQIQF